MNDIANNLSCETRLFADDCVIYREISNNQDKNILQQDLDDLFRWSQLWQRRFNPSKCMAYKPVNKEIQIC